jgi:hypothetical protein
MPVTPEEWLPVSTGKLDARAGRIKKHRDYTNGRAPLPEMGENLRASWKAFQRKSRVDYGGLGISALKNRIRPRGVIIGVDDTHPAMLAARRIWRDNRLTSQFGLAIRDRLETGVGYIAIGRDEEGKAVVTREKPEFFLALSDPLQPWKARVAIKVWRDEIEGKDYALVWVRGSRQRFTRGSKDSAGTAYTRARSTDWKAEEPETYEGAPPIVILPRPDETPLLEAHYDLIDGLLLGKLQRLVITAMQAFRQRALKQTNPERGTVSEQDDDGDDVDYRKIFEPAPGALWDLPEGIDIWESQSTDIRPLLEAEKEDARTFAAMTQTPVAVFIPDSANQSATGATTAKEGHVSVAQDEIDDLKPALAMVIVHALRIEEIDLGDATVEIDFAPAALISLAEKYDAASKAQTTGQARKTIQRTVLGMSAEEIKQDEIDHAAEQLAALTLVTSAGEASNTAAANAADVKARADAMGVLIRSGVKPDEAAKQVGLEGLGFTGAVPVSLRVPESQTDQLEDR